MQFHEVLILRDLQRLILKFRSFFEWSDLFNLLSIHTYQDQHAIVDEMIELFNEDIRVIHAKDFKNVVLR